MKPKYDYIGKDYAHNRRSDPQIAAQIFSKLSGAKKILNIGAGTGSYEPQNVDLTALEPSAEMIAQRSETAHPVVQASAEKLPFETNRFSHVMTVLSMHHWTDRKKAFREINRVATDTFVAVTWNPETKPFWLTRDYFPEIYKADLKIFPFQSEFEAAFDNVEITPLLIPEDCQDGFLAAYWKRPEAYLDAEVRKSISTFSKLQDCSVGLEKLEEDIKSGEWEKKNGSILNAVALDVGYAIVTGEIKKSL